MSQTTVAITPELKLLRQKSPALEPNEDEWPIFELRKVEVVSKNGTLTSLLYADTNNPVTVVGELDTKSAKASCTFINWSRGAASN